MEKKTWLVTGAAGFIGSHLVEQLLNEDQVVIGVDNMSTGKWANLESFLTGLPGERQGRFSFLCEDINNLRMMERACRGVDIVLHQAALASVPLSVQSPLTVHDTNVTGFLNILEAAKIQRVRRVVYASSSAVYGDNMERRKTEKDTGTLLSPYAVTKMTNELYAQQFCRHYQMETLGLRYFNVYGLRQDPQGAYAAVIPKWIAALENNRPIEIYGDGTTTRDFCHVSDVVAANLLAARGNQASVFGKAFNICSGEETSLADLAKLLCSLWEKKYPQKSPPEVRYSDFRSGDIHRSCGSYQLAADELGYQPSIQLRTGLASLLVND